MPPAAGRLYTDKWTLPWISGPTTATISVTPTVNSTYSIVGTNSLGCTSNMVTKTLIVNTTPTIVVNSGAICEGESFTLIPSGANTYTYSSGTQVVTPTADATYSVSGTDVNGCVSSTDAIASVTVNSLPTISVNSGVICAGNSFTMTPSGADTYTFSSGTDVVTPNTDAIYSVSGTDANGCVSISDAIASVTVNALPTLTATTSNTLMCTGETATLSITGALSYTWSTNENTTDILVNPTTTETYTVEGTDGNGCLNTTTITQDVSLCTGLANINGLNTTLISIYPNPNNGLFNIELNTSSQVIVMNALGKIILNQKMTEGKNSLDIQNQSTSIYFVKVIQDGKQHVIKMIKE